MLSGLLFLLCAPVAADDPLRTLDQLRDRADQRVRDRQFTEVVRLDMEVLRLLEGHGPDGDARRAAVNAQLALAYLNLGQITAAEKRIRLAMQHDLQAGVVDSARLIALLAKVRFHQSRYAEAAALLDAAVCGLSAIGDLPKVAISLNDLGMTLAAMQDRNGAEPVLRRAIHLYADSPGHSPISLAEMQANLALVLMQSGAYEQAEPLYAEAVSLMERFLPGNHWLFGILLREHAVALRKTGRKRESRDLERRAGQILASNPVPATRTVDVQALRDGH